jgi:DNA replication licensing factor MCM5
VIRDASTGEFHLEGGALVIADGGLVCIDEFDKMREEDRVAIHEAMEQQTISIAKAGITTILNSRTSVLAAANPVFGRYDDMKSPTDNIDFQTTILSRFDLIFIVRDIQDEKKDQELAKHIINVHRNREAFRSELKEGNLDVEKLKRYIAYARKNYEPRLTQEAADVLKSKYVAFRAEIRDHKKATGTSAIPITVRQLEAIIRITESLARMELATTANVDHVKEAIRLFQVSTFSAATSKFGDRIGSPEFDKAVKRAEKSVMQRVAIGMSISKKNLVADLQKRGHDENAVEKAIQIAATRGQFKLKAQGKLIERVQP